MQELQSIGQWGSESMKQKNNLKDGLLAVVPLSLSLLFNFQTKQVFFSLPPSWPSPSTFQTRPKKQTEENNRKDTHFQISNIPNKERYACRNVIQNGMEQTNYNREKERERNLEGRNIENDDDDDDDDDD